MLHPDSKYATVLATTVPLHQRRIASLAQIQNDIRIILVVVTTQVSAAVARHASQQHHFEDSTGPPRSSDQCAVLSGFEFEFAFGWQHLCGRYWWWWRQRYEYEAALAGGARSPRPIGKRIWEPVSFIDHEALEGFDLFQKLAYH